MQISVHLVYNSHRIYTLVIKCLRADCGLVLNEVFSVARDLVTLQQILFGVYKNEKTIQNQSTIYTEALLYIICYYKYHAIILTAGVESATCGCDHCSTVELCELILIVLMMDKMQCTLSLHLIQSL